MDLVVRDESGERRLPRRIMQADQAVYLHPARVELSDTGVMVVGRHNYPDVVLEVDHTTDVRRGKLKLYESWGFPELWVEVPDRWVASRPGEACSGADDSPSEGGSLPCVIGKRGVSGLDGGGHPRGDERAEAFGADE